MHPSIHSSIYPRLHAYMYPSIHPSIHPCRYVFIHPFICLSIHASIHLVIYSPIHSSIQSSTLHPSIHSPIQHLSIYSLIHPSTHPFMQPSIQSTLLSSCFKEGKGILIALMVLHLQLKMQVYTRGQCDPINLAMQDGSCCVSITHLDCYFQFIMVVKHHPSLISRRRNYYQGLGEGASSLKVLCSQPPRGHPLSAGTYWVTSDVVPSLHMLLLPVSSQGAQASSSCF